MPHAKQLRKMWQFQVVQARKALIRILKASFSSDTWNRRGSIGTIIIFYLPQEDKADDNPNRSKPGPVKIDNKIH